MENQQIRWELLPRAPDVYLRATDLPPIIAQILYNRGVRADEIELFLAADHRLEGNPFLLPDMEQALNRVYKALRSREKIAIYGDFDVDGITATALLAEGLSWLGGEIAPYIPNRFSQGHGLDLSAIKQLGDQGVSLTITVDCGISEPLVVKQAQEVGMDMIITDHHTPSAILPQATAVIDPRRKDSLYPFPDLCGAGVAFKFLQALFHKHSKAGQLGELLDLVALGTVVDMMPLVGENRYLVKQGLRALNNTKRIGLQEMIKLNGLKLGKIDAEDVSWMLGPRLNAPGRIKDSTSSYRLLTTRSPEEAHLLALELEERNAERQKIASEVSKQVKEKLAAKMHLPLLIEGDEIYPVGIIGLVAGKLVDEFHKPAVVINLGSEVCRGSCRSIPEFDILSALQKCHDLLTGLGGHPLAAGFTAPRQNLAHIEQRLMAMAAELLSQVDIRPKLVIDAELPLSVLANETLDLIQKLGPFGKGNPQPTFLSRQANVVEHHNFGNQGTHLGLKLKQGNVTWRAVDFDSPKAQQEIPPYIDIVYNLEKSWWSGEKVLQLNLLDFAPSESL